MNPDIKKHLSKDPILAELSERYTLHFKNNYRTVEHALCASIISQQLSVKAADTIYSRFLALFPNNEYSSDLLLSIVHEDLRSVGLSNSKAKYVKNVAQFFQENDLHPRVWSQMDDQEIIQKLTEIKGVGVWTAQMIMIFKLERPDVFPIQDLGIRQGMIKLYALTSEKKQLNSKLIQIAESWKPYRSYASRLIWESLNNKE